MQGPSSTYKVLPAFHAGFPRDLDVVLRFWDPIQSFSHEFFGLRPTLHPPVPMHVLGTQQINEMGATRFDVAVRALRGELDPPEWVENTERSSGEQSAGEALVSGHVTVVSCCRRQGVRQRQGL